MPSITKFSIIVPYHNAHETIRDTVHSVIAQNMERLEIIIVDDRSAPTSVEFLKNLARDDDRIKIIKSTRPGPSAARNAAVDVSTGDIICFLDADDCLRLGTLRFYEKAFRRIPGLGIAFGRVRITSNPARPGGIVTPHCAAPTLAQIIGENRVCTTSNIVVRREALTEIGGFDENLTHAEDQEWLARAYLNQRWVLRGMDRVTLDYRTSPNGLSSDLRKMERGWLKMLATFQAREPSVSHRQIAAIRGTFYRYLARRALRLGVSRIDGATYFGQAVTSYPKIVFSEVKRTWSTAIAAMAVLFFGPRLFHRVLH